MAPCGRPQLRPSTTGRCVTSGGGRGGRGSARAVATRGGSARCCLPTIIIAIASRRRRCSCCRHRRRRGGCSTGRRQVVRRSRRLERGVLEECPLGDAPRRDVDARRDGLEGRGRGRGGDAVGVGRDLAEDVHAGGEVVVVVGRHAVADDDEVAGRHGRALVCSAAAHEGGSWMRATAHARTRPEHGLNRRSPRSPRVCRSSFRQPVSSPHIAKRPSTETTVRTRFAPGLRGRSCTTFVYRARDRPAPAELLDISPRTTKE